MLLYSMMKIHDEAQLSHFVTVNKIRHLEKTGVSHLPVSLNYFVNVILCFEFKGCISDSRLKHK